MMLRSKVVLFIVIVSTGLLFNHYFVWHQLDHKKEIFPYLNRIARQRMWSQALVKANYYVYLGKPSGIDSTKAIQQLEEFRAMFVSGDAYLVSNTSRDRRLQASLNTLHVQSLSLVELTDRLKEANDEEERKSLLKSLDEKQQEFLLLMEEFVDSYEREGSAFLAQLSALSMVLSVALVVLILGGFFYTLYPLFKEVEATNEKLSTENKQLLEVSHKVESDWQNYSVFIEQAPGAIAMFDKQMRYLVASSKWYKDYGLQGHDIIGKSHYDIFPEIGEDWKKIHEECMQGAINRADEAPFQREDGSMQWLTWDVRPWKNQRGEIGGIIMYTADLTEYKNLSLEQEHLREIFSSVSNTARIGAWEVNMKTSEVYWSEITKKIHEVDADYMPNLNGAIQFYKEGQSRDTIYSVFEEAVHEGKSYDVELELVTAKGNSLWVRAIGHAVMEQGKCVRMYGVFQDIQSIKEQQFKIANLLEHLNTIMDAATEVSIIGTDMNGIITHFSKGAESMLGYQAQEMIGIHTPELIHVENEVKERALILSEEFQCEIAGFEVFVHYAKLGKPDTQKWTYICKDGTLKRVLLSVTALKDAEGKIIGFLGVATDLTQILKLKEEAIQSSNALKILTDKLQRQNHQLLNFAHITSHNLRSPVSNLNSLVILYEMSESQEERQEVFSNFAGVIHHLSDTLNELVDSLKVQRDLDKERELLSFESVFQKTKEILSGQVMESKALITEDFVEAPQVLYPKSYLESIMLNLMSNAIKYRSPDRIPEIHFKTYQEDGATILIVKDNGLGLDMNEQGHKLFGLNKTFHRHAESKGVGLFMTKTQVEAMGGSISAEGEVNQGMTFKVVFNKTTNDI